VTSHVYYAKRTRMDHFGIGAAVFEKAGARPTAQAETPFANSHRSALRSGAADRGLAKSPQHGVRTQREASKKPRSLDLHHLKWPSQRSRFGRRVRIAEYDCLPASMRLWLIRPPSSFWRKCKSTLLPRPAPFASRQVVGGLDSNSFALDKPCHCKLSVELRKTPHLFPKNLACCRRAPRIACGQS
jgi:hypothetical protein